VFTFGFVLCGVFCFDVVFDCGFCNSVAFLLNLNKINYCLGGFVGLFVFALWVRLAFVVCFCVCLVCCLLFGCLLLVVFGC